MNRISRIWKDQVFVGEGWYTEDYFLKSNWFSPSPICYFSKNNLSTNNNTLQIIILYKIFFLSLLVRNSPWFFAHWHDRIQVGWLALQGPCYYYPTLFLTFTLRPPTLCTNQVHLFCVPQYLARFHLFGVPLSPSCTCNAFPLPFCHIHYCSVFENPTPLI